MTNTDPTVAPNTDTAEPALDAPPVTQGEPAPWAAPEFVPEDMRAETAEETMQRLAEGYGKNSQRVADLQAKLSKQPAAPKSADEYQFEPSETLKDYFAGDEQNQMIGFAKEAALEHGIPTEKFGDFVNSVYQRAHEANLLMPAFNPQAELDQFTKAIGDPTRATQQLEANQQFAEGLINQLKLPAELDEATAEGVKAEIMAMTNSATGNIALQALMTRMRQGGGLPLGGEGGTPGALTASDIEKLARDPRIDPRNRNHADPQKAFDPDLRKQYDAWHATQAG